MNTLSCRYIQSTSVIHKYNIERKRTTDVYMYKKALINSYSIQCFSFYFQIGRNMNRTEQNRCLFWQKYTSHGHITKIVWKRTKTYTHAHTHTHASTHARTHTRTHAYIHAPTHARTYAHTHTHVHTRTHMCTHTHTHTRIRARTHAHTHACTHTYTIMIK